MVFDFHRSCLQSAITVNWRKPTIFGDAKIDYYLLKVSLTEHVQNILRLHVYAYYTWPLTGHKAPVLTFRTCHVTLVLVTPLCRSTPPNPSPPHPICMPEAFLSCHYRDLHNANMLSVVTQHFSEKNCVTIIIENDSFYQPATSFGFSPSLN